MSDNPVQHADDVRRLRVALRGAIEELEDMIPYVPEPQVAEFIGRELAAHIRTTQGATSQRHSDGLDAISGGEDV